MFSFKSLAVSALLALSMSAIADAGNFTLSSPTIKPNGMLGSMQLFDGFGCAGGNISPALDWRDAPLGTKSFALTVYDPDAPTGSGWWHWVVLNLPATASGLAEAVGNPSGASLPVEAIQVRNDFGQPGFGGACPPAGDKAHRYVFTVYALKTARIDLPSNASAAFAGFMIHTNAIGSANITAFYGR